MSEVAKILFVDDEVRIVNSLMGLFYKHYEVYTATDASQALTILQDNHIHVIVSDQRMPGITGVELLSKVKEISPHTVRLLLTGYSDLDAILSSINEGEIFKFINKPWDNSRLKDTISKAAKIGVSIQNAVEYQAPSNDDIHPQELAIHRANILVIGLDQNIAKLVKQKFGRHHSVVHADHYDLALNILKQHKIDIVVTDIDSNDVNSLNIIQLINQEHPATIMLAMSKQIDAHVTIQMINLGQVFRYLQLPIEEDILHAAMLAALDSIPNASDTKSIQQLQSHHSTQDNKNLYRYIAARMKSAFHHTP